MSTAECSHDLGRRPSVSKSPEIPVVAPRTRYGRIIGKRSDLPGEDQVPTDRRKKKDKREDKAKSKRKYTRRAYNSALTVDERKKLREESKLLSKEKFKKRVQKVIDEQIKRQQQQPPPRLPEYNKERQCELCNEKVPKFRMEQHLLDNHPDFAPFECLSCRTRTFFSYWELKAHYKECSNGRIAVKKDRVEPSSSREFVEAPYYRRLYEPVECPLCMVHLATFFDLDVHLSVHGLATIDAKFACDGCNTTYTSVDKLKKHLFITNKNVKGGACHNRGRVLNRREIVKMMERFTVSDRAECMRKFNDPTYIVAPPQILDSSQEETCAYCGKKTRAFVLLLRNLSNLDKYGLKFPPGFYEKLKQAIKDYRGVTKEGGRIAFCRVHFAWKNWISEEDEISMGKARALVMVEKELRFDIMRRHLNAPKANPLDQTSIAHQRYEELLPTVDVILKRREAAMIAEKRAEKAANESSDANSAMAADCSNSGHHQKRIKLEDEDDYEFYVYQRNRHRQEGVLEEEEEEDLSVNKSEAAVQIQAAEEEPMEEDEEEPATEDSSDEALDLSTLPMNCELNAKVEGILYSPHTCPVCKISFDTLDLLHEHDMERHADSKLVYRCADCPDKILDTPQDVKTHFEEKISSVVASFYSFKLEIYPNIDAIPAPEGR